MVACTELEMEGIWKIAVGDFTELILGVNKGNDFLKQIKPKCYECTKK